jgi:hypothetical protein
MKALLVFLRAGLSVRALLMRAFLAAALLSGVACFGQNLPSDFVVADTGGHYVHIYPAKFRKPLLLVYFQPDCGECQAFVGKLVKHSEIFRRYQVVMVTNAGLGALRQFAAAYRLGGRKGLILGTEGWTNFLFRNLGVQRFPFVAVYDRQRLVVAFPEAGELFKP